MTDVTDDAEVGQWIVPFWYLAVLVQIPVALGVIGVLPLELAVFGSIGLLSILLTGVQEQVRRNDG